MIELQKLPVAQGMKYLEAQLCSGGIIDPRSGFRRLTDQSLRKGLVTKTIIEEIECFPEELKFKIEGRDVTLTQLLDPVNKTMLVRRKEDFHLFNPDSPVIQMECIYLVCNRRNPIRGPDEVLFPTTWKKECRLSSLHDANLVSDNSVEKICDGMVNVDTDSPIYNNEIRPWVTGNPMPIAGVIISKTGRVLNFNEAVEEKILKSGFARSLQEAQASNGCIIDPKDGNTYTVDEAVMKKLVKENQADILRRAEKGATRGYEIEDRDTADGIPVKKEVGFFQALKRNIINLDHAMRMLEVQLACGGIIDPNLNHRLPKDLAK